MSNNSEELDLIANVEYICDKIEELEKNDSLNRKSILGIKLMDNKTNAKRYVEDNSEEIRKLSYKNIRALKIAYLFKIRNLKDDNRIEELYNLCKSGWKMNYEDRFSDNESTIYNWFHEKRPCLELTLFRYDERVKFILEYFDKFIRRNKTVRYIIDEKEIGSRRR